MKKRYKVLIIVAAFIFVSNSIATKVIYDNIFSRYDRKEELSVLSDERYADLLSGREDIKISTKKDNYLQAYHYDSDDDGVLVIMAPGLHSGADDYLPVIQYLYDDGEDVLIFDPSGCIGSTGKSTKGFSQEVYDLEAAIDYAEKEYPDKKIVLMGHSRGGFAVCNMIGTDHDIAGIVSVSGLNSPMEAIIGLSSKYVGKAANLNYPSLWAYQAMLFGTKMMNVKAHKLISEGNVPVLVVQGSEDTTSPMDEYSIYSHIDEVTGSNSEFKLFSEPEHSGHTDLLYDEDGVNEEVLSYICNEFIDNCSDEDVFENAS